MFVRLINWTVFLFLSSACFALADGGQSAVAGSAPCGEEVVFGLPDGRKLLEQRQAYLRIYLWDHWRENKTAAISAVRKPKDQPPNRTCYTIQRDSAGNMHLIVEYWTTYRNGLSGESGSRVDRFDATSVTRTKIPQNGSEELQQVPSSEAHPGDYFWLLLKSTDGKSQVI